MGGWFIDWFMVNFNCCLTGWLVVVICCLYCRFVGSFSGVCVGLVVGFVMVDCFSGWWIGWIVVC